MLKKLQVQEMSINASLPAGACRERRAAQPYGHPSPHAENSSSDQRQACKKHELYVSFRDLGWQVRAVGDWGVAHHLPSCSSEIKPITGWGFYPLGEKIASCP